MNYCGCVVEGYSAKHQDKMGDLEAVFKSFCAFGAGAKGGAAMMDNGKFAKLFRDLKLLDKKLTATDIDIIFNRPEVKG